MSAKQALDVDALLRAYDKLDRALVKAGFPATSKWWRQQIERFFRSGRRRWVIRAGRRAGKSSTLCRLAVCWAIAGTWYVPPGDTAVVPFVSTDRDEASGRIRTIADILTALGIEHTETADEISLPSKRLRFSVKTCSTRGTVGFTAIAIFGDEMARWESRDNAANPAKEVMGSLRPTMATQPYAFEVCSSSPWGEDDYHAELFELGDTDHQCASFAPTWVANPTITEERTHELEPDDRIWSREYAAIPGATVSAALDREDALAAFEPFQHRSGSPFVAIDASSLRGDAFAWISGRHTKDYIGIELIQAFEGEQLRCVTMATVVETIAAEAKDIGADDVFGDQRESASLETLFRQQGVNFYSHAWTEPSKDAAFQLMRRLLKERKLHIVEHEQLRKQMVSCKAHLRPSGRTYYATNGLDYLSAIVTLLHAALVGRINIDAENDGNELRAVIAFRGSRSTDGSYGRGHIRVCGSGSTSTTIAEVGHRMSARRHENLDD